MRFPLPALCATVLSSGALALTGPALDANFESTSPWRLPSTSDTLRPLGDAAVREGVLELGRNGLAVLEDYRQPQGPFSIEARFKLSSYAPSSTRWIADLVNTATWTSSSSQGFTMRVGGGELYPVLPGTAYDGADGGGELYRYIDRPTSASLSRCIGEFNISTGGLYWKEVYTDVCVDLDRWVHMVAVYDGTDMRIFLDGKDATDGWRVQAQASKPVLDGTAQLHLGARTEESYDSRHADGQLDFVRIHDSALSASGIRRRFKALAVDESRARCGRMPVVVSPAPGKSCDRNAKIEVKLVATPGCLDVHQPSGWKKGDVVRIRVHKGWMDDSPLELTMTDSSGTFGDLLPEGMTFPGGEALVTVALDSLQALAPLAARASASLDYQSATPVVFAATTGARPLVERAAPSPRWIDGNLHIEGQDRPEVSAIDGSTSSWTMRRTESGWSLSPSRSARGVHLVRTQAGSSIVVLP